MSTKELFSYLEHFLDYGIMGFLLLLSFIAFWLFIERMLFYRKIDVNSYTNRDALELDLTNNLGTISIIGSNAPYIGLLGTVIGIMLTFYTMGEVGEIDAKKIMIGLSMALKATAMGLVVAIPAMVFYTISLRKVERILTKFDISKEI